MKGSLTKILLLSILLCLIVKQDLIAQFTTQIGTATTSSLYYGPVYKPSTTNGFDFSRYSYLYTADELTVLDSGSIINSISFYKTTSSQTEIDANFNVYIENVSKTSLSSGVNWSSVISSATLVYSSSAFQFGDSIGWIKIPVTPFVYAGQDIQISTDFDISASDPPVDGPIEWRYHGTPSLKTIGKYFSSAPMVLDVVNSPDINRRPNLLISYAPTPTDDAGIIAITSLQAVINAGSISVDVIVENFGGNPLDSFEVYASLVKEPELPVLYGPAKYNGPKIGLTSLSDTLNIFIDTIGGGNFTLCVWTSNPNGSSDDDNSNDTLCFQFESIAPLEIPLIEDFETFIAGSPGTFMNHWTTSPASGFQWYVEDASGANENSIDTGPFFDHTNFGSSGGVYIYTEASSGSTGDSSYLISPEIVLNSNLNVPVLSFWYHMFGATIGELHFDIKNGSGWNRDFIPPVIGQHQTSGDTAWIEVRDTLDEYIGETVQIRFRAIRGSSYTGDISLDDFSITDPTVPDLTITNIFPGSGCDLTSSETVLIGVKNIGGTATSTPIPVELEVTGPVNSGLINDVINNTINPGSTFYFSVPTTVDLSTYGDYIISASVNLAADPAVFNNDFITQVTNTPEISSFPYFESFEGGSGGWTASGTNKSWALGTPSHTTIQGASDGTEAWSTGGGGISYTNNEGQAGFYNSDENSWVIGPCFNFSTLSSIEILLDIWWNAENSYDGAVLQGSIDFGDTWMNVGSFGEPNNWYNDNSISGSPGGSSEGWTGRASSGNGSNGWVTAKHTLSQFLGEPRVLLRIAFGSDGIAQDDGFAFDNVIIRETSNIDLGVVDIIAPEGCDLTSSETISLTIKNFANQTLVGPADIPVVITLNGGGEIEDTITVTSFIITGGQSIFALNHTVDLSVPGEYSIKAWTVADTDGNNSNDTATASTESLHTPSSPVATGDTVCVNGTAMLRASSTEVSSFRWYASAAGTTILGTDSIFITPAVDTNTTFYVEVISGSSAFVGPVDNTIGTGANYTSTASIEMDVFQETTILSALFYPSTAGNRTINVYDQSGSLHATYTVYMDTTGRYDLNIMLPVGTGIELEITSPNLYRNNGGVSYPYEIPGQISINNSSAGTGYYYFFYNMLVGTTGCPSPRVPVLVEVSPPISTSIIGTDASVSGASDGSADLTVSGGTPSYSFNWSNSAATEDISGLAAGTYFVTVTDAFSCSATDQVTIDEPISCSTGTIVTGISTTDIRITRAKLTWDALPGTNKFEIRGKRIAPVVDPTNTQLSVSGSQTSLFATGLIRNSTFQWEIRALCNASGTVATPWSGLTQFTTGICDNPGNTNTLNITTSTATLDWDTIAYPHVVGYRVVGGTLGDFSVTLDIGNPATTQLNVSSLASNTTYNWGVLAACLDGPGQYVFSNSATTPIQTFTTLGAMNKISVSALERVFSIYPNPATNMINILIPEDKQSESSFMAIYDLNGKEMMRLELTSNIFNIAQLAEGYYEIRIITPGEKYTEKLLIMR